MSDTPRAIRHQFRASSFAVVRFEDLKEIANLKADLVACYKPVNSQELFAVERIALAQQAILRGARLEAGLFTSAFNEATDPYDGRPFTPMSETMVGDGDIEITRAQNRNYGVAEGFRRLAKESNGWSLLMRYQVQAERQYRRAIEEFERLKKLRPELPSQPGIEPQPGLTPEETKDIAPPSEINPSIEIATPSSTTERESPNNGRSGARNRAKARCNSGFDCKRPGQLIQFQSSAPRAHSPVLTARFKGSSPNG